MILSTRRFLLPLLCVAALAGGTVAATAEPAFAVTTVPIVAVTSSQTPSVFGQSVTLTTTITGTGGNTPTGTVSFFDGASPLCATVAVTGTVNTATATCTTAALSVATHSITGQYSGDVNYDPTTSTAFSQIVAKADTTTALASSANPSVSGQSVTFTATVAPVAPGAGTRTGTVDFKNGATDITGCAASAITAGVATCATSTLPVAANSITAIYSGDTNFTTSTSTALIQNTGKADTTTALTSSANPSTFGQAVTFTATIAPVAPGAGTRTGTVDFKNGATDITGCAASAITAGVATCATSTLPVAANSITAIYSGDTNFNTSTSTALVQTTGTASSSTVVLSGTNPSVFSAPVTFTATVTSGGGTPTGTVAFKTGATTITGCATSAITAGSATCTTSALAVGTQAITAVYSGNATIATSTSTAVSQVVNKAATTSSVSSSDLTTTFGDPVTFTATIAPVSPAVTTPSIGTVSFNADGVPIDTCGAKALTGGVATCATTSDPAGTAQITAVFSGDTNFTASTSSAIAQVVAKAATTMALTATPNPSRSGEIVTLAATVTSTAGIPTGDVVFSRVKNDSSLETIGTDTLAAGHASISLAGLPVENGDVVATYATTTNYLASTHTTAHAVQRSVSKPFIASSQKNSKLGKPVTFGISVVAVSPGSGTPTGLVSLYRERANGSRQWIGRGNLHAGGLTSITVTDLPLGSYKVVAVYRGSTSFRTSERSMTQTVTS